MPDAVTIMIERGRGKKHAGMKERIRWLVLLDRKRVELENCHGWCQEACRQLAAEYQEHGLVHTAGKVLREFDMR